MRFVGGRIAHALIILVLVTAVAFLLLHLLPGGPARAMLAKDATQQQVAEFNHQLGYDQPLPVQYAIWLSRLLRGNLGYSYQLNEPVSEALGRALPNTLLLMILSTILALAIAIGVGALQAVRRGRRGDHLVTLALFVMYATPSFFLGLVLVLIFAVYLHVFPAVAPSSQTLSGLLGSPLGLVLPVTTLALTHVTTYARYMRSSVLDNLGEDYVRTARAKGLAEWPVMRRHVLRNSLLPMITLLGLSLPRLLGGALVVEQVFNYPGMGLLFWNATMAQDYPVLLAGVLLVGAAVVMGSLLADLAYAVLDPRIRYGRAV